MPKNDQQEAFEKLLSAALLRAIDSVKFAETKNAALLTFSSVWIVAIVNLLFTKDITQKVSVTLLALSVLFFVTSALISIWAIRPRNPLTTSGRQTATARSLLFFGDVARISPHDHLKRLLDAYYPPEGEVATNSYIEDLVGQLNANSKVVALKLYWFNVGGFVAAAAIATVATAALTGSIDLDIFALVKLITDALC